MLGERFEGFEEIRAVYDWKTFLRQLRPVSADRDIKKMFSIQMQVNDDATVKVRSKDTVSAAVPFSRWFPMVPHPDKPDSVLPHRDIPIATDTPKQWTDFEEKIVPNLLEFYRHTFPHPCYIPLVEQKEMIQFLVDGPTPNFPPEWITWGDVEPRDTEELGAAAATTTVPTSPRRGGVWRPFLQPRVNANGKKCRCGSQTHLKITHRACPLNPERVPHRVPEAQTQKAPKPFPYPVGTWVAFEFTTGIFAGTITEVYESEGEAHVVFTDGDEGDYDADEICYATQLYKSKFTENE